MKQTIEKIIKLFFLFILISGCNKENNNKPPSTLKEHQVKKEFDINSTIKKLLIDDKYLYILTDKNVELWDKYTNTKKDILIDNNNTIAIDMAMYDSYIYVLNLNEVKIFNKENGALYKAFSLNMKKDIAFSVLVDDRHIYTKSFRLHNEEIYLSIFNKNNGSLIKNIEIKWDYFYFYIDDSFIYTYSYLKDNIHIYRKSTFDYDGNISLDSISSLQIKNNEIYATSNRKVFVFNKSRKLINNYSIDDSYDRLYLGNKYAYWISWDGIMKIFNLSKQKTIHTLAIYDHLSIDNHILIDNNNLYLIDPNRQLQIIDISNDSTILRNNKSKYFIKKINLKNKFNNMLLSPFGNYISYVNTTKGHIELLNINTNEIVLSLHSYRLGETLLFTSDEKYFIYENNDNLIILNLDTKSKKIIMTKEKYSYEPPPMLPSLLSRNKEDSREFFAPRVRVPAISLDNQNILYFSHTGKSIIMEKSIHTDSEAKELSTQPSVDFVDNLEFSPDRKYVVYTDRNVSIVNIKTSTKINLGLYAQCLAFNPDSKSIAVCVNFYTKENIYLYDINGKLIQSINIPHIDILSIIYSPNGKYIITGNNDSTIMVWDINKNKLAKTIKGHTEEVNFLFFSQDGSKLISGSKDKTIRIWNFSSLIIDYELGI